MQSPLPNTCPRPAIRQNAKSTTPPFQLHASSNDNDDDEAEMERMRQEIEDMRREALQRINSLSSKVPAVVPAAAAAAAAATTTNAAKDTRRNTLGMGGRSSSSSYSSASRGTTVADVKERDVDELSEGEYFEKRILERQATDAASGSVSHDKITAFMERKTDCDLLDGTSWKVLLNIGREPGTWMPKTWGVSGDRLLLNLEVCFSSDQHYERDDFLGSAGGAKACRAVESRLTMGPNMSEGSRTFRVLDGGWRIGEGEGPLGTDLLRFYVEIEEDISHSGGDVYCPAGRIYCTCGYFPMNHAPDGKKLELRRKLDRLGVKHDDLQSEIEKEGIFSLKRVKMTKQMFDINMEAQNLRKQLTAVSVTDPDKSLLKFSRKGNVALTKEGGVCCKVKKSAVTTEYHILGKFGLGAVDHEH
eukprot:CAMPEP_0172495924 /NCGR_PEP_ID=MMETSP1066-20121228/79730_1 /TAXON_ID=671091 /ORGANISM="Coscinodiscus wailesii, Strain CCMP2513" /LENGTH=416 /DNA_ID=CAMNT_0013267941 /DNA_START=190 /DNA_END=1440 /DNA_ORIENTATION=+